MVSYTITACPKPIEKLALCAIVTVLSPPTVLAAVSVTAAVVSAGAASVSAFAAVVVVCCTVSLAAAVVISAVCALFPQPARSVMPIAQVSRSDVDFFIVLYSFLFFLIVRYVLSFPANAGK